MAAAAARVEEPRRYRMKDLCELTGLSRQAIHFYIQQGLLPAGEKAGRNMAWYNAEHVERLQTIRRLQHEQFLPLKAIKAVLDGETGGFEVEQRALLRDVKQRLSGPLGTPPDNRRLDAREVAARAGVDEDELMGIAEIGTLPLNEAADGTLEVRAEDAWIIEQWGRIREAGFTKELGFQVSDLAIYIDSIHAMFERERTLLLSRMAHLPPAKLALMIDGVLPVLNEFVTRYHTAQIRDFFAAVD